MQAIRSVKKDPIKASVALLLLSVLAINVATGQKSAPSTDPAPRVPLPPAPAPLGIPTPGLVTEQPYAPQPILQGGIVVTLFPPGSKYLKADKVREAEKYNLTKDVPGRISSIVNIHNPSIEVHLVDKS